MFEQTDEVLTVERLQQAKRPQDLNIFSIADLGLQTSSSLGRRYSRGGYNEYEQNHSRQSKSHGKEKEDTEAGSNSNAVHSTAPNFNTCNT